MPTRTVIRNNEPYGCCMQPFGLQKNKFQKESVGTVRIIRF